jgi:hypothetical protein
MQAAIRSHRIMRIRVLAAADKTQSNTGNVRGLNMAVLKGTIL